MRSLVIPSRSGLVLDFEAADFGGVDQDAVIADWLARRTASHSRRPVCVRLRGSSGRHGAILGPRTRGARGR
jgi:hypothetical protein